MKLKSISVKDWRSFRGINAIELSTDPEKPITLLLAPNGAGKTALLNAFTWALYGEFTEGFDQADQLVNLQALSSNPSAEAVVELVIEHGDDEYFIQRRTGPRGSQGSVKVQLNGTTVVEEAVHKLLAKPLKDLFFFPAETFSTASVLKGASLGDGTSFDVGRAIRALLAGDIYDRASENLRKAIESDELKPPKNFRDETVEGSRVAWEQAQAELDDIEARREQLPGLLAKAREDAAKAKRDAEKFDMKKIKEWEAQREARLEKVNQLEILCDEGASLLNNLLREAHFHLSSAAVKASIDRLNAAERFGLMPPRIHENVLARALQEEKCVLCGRELTVESKGRIEKLRLQVNKAHQAIRGLEVRSRLQHYLESKEEATAELRNEASSYIGRVGGDPVAKDAGIVEVLQVLRATLNNCRFKLDAAKEELDEFDSRTDSVPIPEAGTSPVEVAIIRQQNVTELQREVDKIHQLRAEALDLVDKRFDEYRKKSASSKEYQRKTRAIAVLKEAKAFIDQARQGLESYGRKDFQAAINQTYRDLIHKSYDIAVTEDFSLEVRAGGSDTSIALSQSEKVLLLIAFLGAIARLAPHYERIARDATLFDEVGSVETSRDLGFPVVLDSPTSPLDEEYELGVIKALPALLPQVVIPVSAKSLTNWQEINHKVGRVYIMELTSASSSNRTINWLGKDYTYSRCDKDIKMASTQVREIVANQEAQHG